LGYFYQAFLNIQHFCINSNSEKFKNEVDIFIVEYETHQKEYQNSNSYDFNFDFRESFIAGTFAGLGSFGALAFWAASLGNLGGYILVAQFVSFLSALGIGFGFSGGTAGIIAFVAAIGGPIVLGIALSSSIGLAVAKLVSSITESWQKRLAKQTVKYFQEQDIIDKFADGINEFWEDTTKSFNQGADAVEKDWQRYLDHLREITSPEIDSKERIEKIIKILEELQNFFKQIPWLSFNFKDCM